MVLEPLAKSRIGQEKVGAQDKHGQWTLRLNAPTYNSPEERKRVTGSVRGIGCRLKSQRATANPTAA